MDDDNRPNRWRVAWVVIWVLTAPLTWIGPFLLLTIILMLLGGGKDPSGRIAAFGQPLMVYFILGLPVYFIVVCVLTTRGKLPGTRAFKKS